MYSDKSIHYHIPHLLESVNRGTLTYFSREEISVKTSKELALHAENESKNWGKIVVKFGLWFLTAFLVQLA